MNPTDLRHLDVAAFSHPGLSGRNNEDRYAVASYAGPARKPVLFAVVCDGIGGHQAGEVAAQLAVDEIIESVTNSDGRQPLRIMATAIMAASRSIALNSAHNPEQAGMGATCACIWIEGSRLYTAHVGDSRIYLLRNGALRRLTVDHTWVEEAIDIGLITREQAPQHPNAHVLRRHLGSAAPPVVDFRQRINGDERDVEARRRQGARLQPGDLLMACSDGLTDLLPETEIAQLLAEQGDLQVAAEELVARANQRGGYDNETVVLIGMAAAPAHAAEIRGATLRKFLGRRDTQDSRRRTPIRQVLRESVVLRSIH
jgi:PPM family protein phosphatase